MKRWGYYFVCIGVMCGMLLGAYWGNRVVSVISEGLSGNSRHCVILDPGHGGEDGGASSCTGRLESAYNLEIALRLDDLLRLLGYDTKLIRKEDVSVYTTGQTIAQKKVSDLKERVKTVNAAPNGILISIHQNYFTDSRYSGAQVFYGTSEGSEALAKKLQAAVVTALNPGSRRNAKQGRGIYLLEHVRCPGVLVECGFLSNPQEEALLREPSYQKKLCCVIGTALSQYLNP